MKIQHYLGIALVFTVSLLLVSFKNEQKKQNEAPVYEYMQVNVLESVLKGGVGRSRMIVTDVNGKSDEPVNLNNYYSMTGLNFTNIQENETKVVLQLNMLGKQGWEVVSTSTGGNEVYFTKYVLRRLKQ
jgi:hypothetical protein